MKYQARFTGRTVGAIGVSYGIQAETEGATPEAARLALYDRYEHIHGLELTPIPTPLACGDCGQAGCEECGPSPACEHGWDCDGAACGLKS